MSNNNEETYIILKKPHVSEKATVMSSRFNQYTFKVQKDANKQQIQMAVESIFKVKVRGVNVVNVSGKRKKFRMTSGVRSDWKKAYVSLEPGHEIDYHNLEL